MNKPNVMRLAKAFATQELATRGKNPIGYNQEMWEAHRRDLSGNECGTTCCVAGWAVHLLAPRRLDEARVSVGFATLAQGLLGLSDDQRIALFSANANPADRRPEHFRHATCTVAAVLKNLAETGKVEWNKAFDEAREANGQS